MLTKIIEIILVGFLVYSSIADKITQKVEEVSFNIEFLRGLDGISQGLIVVLIQTIALIIAHRSVQLFSKIFTFKLTIVTGIKNNYYGTNFTLISYDEKLNEETIDKERKLSIEIKIHCITKSLKPILAFFIKDLYLYYELKRNDIKLKSFDKNAEKTENGIRYSLNNLVEKHMLEKDEVSYEVKMTALLSFDKPNTKDNDEILYIYPKLYNKDKKVTIFSKFLLKEIENHKIKVIIKKINSDLEGE